MDRYIQELDAIQRWVFATTGLATLRLKAAPSKVARPTILWEAASRGRDRHVSRWAYVNGVIQFGKIYVVSLDQLYRIQGQLQQDLEERLGRLPLFDKEGAEGVQVGWLTDVQVEFDNGGSNEAALDTLIRVRYEVTYNRPRPEPAPYATFVGTRTTGGGTNE